ncbi:hypothetical protein EXS65_00245 [Candidatus Peribacteria bacterium]|nr:hypothetical protein [Candidatus Peribacteria bacterium]
MKPSDPAHGDSTPSKVLLAAIERLSLPALLFGIVFFVTMIAVTIVLTPDRFPVRIGDRVVRLIDLEAEQEKLLLEKADLQAKHIDVVDAKTPALHLLGSLKPRNVSVGTVLLAIESVRTRFKTDSVDPISLPQISVSGSGTVIKIAGEVRDIGGSTMRTLASFVDQLRAIPLVSSVSEPEYVERKETDDSTTVSPFSMTIILHDASS